MSKVRINRFLASTGAISRRKADELIEHGRVRINNEKALLGDTLDPDKDVVALDGKTRIPSEHPSCSHVQAQVCDDNHE